VRKLINIFAIWLIAFILPVQGIAAATVMNCENLQSQQTQESVSGHCHEHEAAVDSHAHKNQDNSKHACNHCSKCTACCSGFTFAASGDDLIHQLDIATAGIVFASPDFTSYIPSGPERPPRFTLI
jgi:hypothetical protein